MSPKWTNAAANAGAGAGIAMLPTFYIGHAVQEGQLTLVLPNETLKPLDIHAVYLSRRYQPKCLRLLIDFPVEHFGGAKAPWDMHLRAYLRHDTSTDTLVSV